MVHHKFDACKTFLQNNVLPCVELSPASESGMGSGDRVLEAVQLLLRELNQTQLETVRDTVTGMLR